MCNLIISVKILEFQQGRSFSSIPSTTNHSVNFMREDINSNSRYWTEVKCFIWTEVELPENINRMSACLDLNIAVQR